MSGHAGPPSNARSVPPASLTPHRTPPSLPHCAFFLLGNGATGRAAIKGKGPQRQSQQRLDRRLEEVAKAVGGGYCRLQMQLRLALAVWETPAGHRLGALKGGVGWGGAPLLPMHPWLRGLNHFRKG